MTIKASNRYSVTVDQGKGAGSPWIVRVHRTSFPCKRQISSDWFLDREQAERFARDTAHLLEADRSATLLKQRKPGWTLRRPNH